MAQIKKIDIKEFRELGYLQELNRQFLHPLGLALEVVIDESGNEFLGGVWDYRDDPEGIIYAIQDSDEERKNKFKEKANYIKKQLEEKSLTRKEKLGYIQEPLD